MSIPRRDLLAGMGALALRSRLAAAQHALVNAPSPSGTDDTGALQALIGQLGRGGVLDGAGQEYVVTRLLLKSNMTLRNFRFRAKGTATPLDAVLTIDGNCSTASDIVIRNVHIDGNRAAQTNLESEEDGGRDGIRIVGKAERLLLANCSAVNCATDGLKIFSHRALSRNDASLNFKDLYVSNCRFLNNRRHGASGDSLENVYFIDCEFSGNGVDHPGGKEEGRRGAVDGGMIYGTGVDIEGYGVGSGVDGLFFIRCQARRNARFAFQFWEPTSPLAPGFLPRRNIVFERCAIGGGVSPRHGQQALEFSQPVGVRGDVPTYSDISVIGLDCAGTVILNGVHNANFAGGTMRSPYRGFWGIAHRSKNVSVIGVEAEGKILAMKG
jgi:hypothetical protein